MDRWDAFTDEEFEELARACRVAEGEGQFDAESTLYVEIVAEAQRRDLPCLVWGWPSIWERPS